MTGCGGHGGSLPASPTAMTMPHGVSPALIKPAPMANTKILPATAMRSPADRHVDSIGRSWTQIPGTAAQVAAAPDGSIWVLSDQPAGPDKYIWHYVNGTWTNVGGMATQLAMPPNLGNNFLYAINSGGGVWVYNINTSTWFSIGGGVKSISLDMGGNLYAVSNGSTGDAALWEYPSGPTSQWMQIAGSGVSVAGGVDGNAYTLPSGGIASNNGTFILNSAGSIYYENRSPSVSFGSIPGAASQLAPTNGGAFVLGYPASSSGETIYYYNFPMPGWLAQAGAAISLSADGYSLYAVGASGAIYQTSATGMMLAGGKTSLSFTASGGTLSFPSYNGVSGSFQWGSNNSTSSFPVTMNWGVGSDLPSTFTPLPGSIGTPLIYVDTVPGSTGKVTFTQTPGVTVTTSSTFPGTKCGFAFFSNMSGGSTYSWTSMTGVGLSEVSPSGNTFTIPPGTLGAGQTVDLNRGQDQFIALYCH